MAVAIRQSPLHKNIGVQQHTQNEKGKRLAKYEQNRENIMREATALVRRIELSLPGHEVSCLIGFRRDGAASVFFGIDPVYQFNADSELRRAFIDGKLVKAEQGKLVWLVRRRTESEVQLLRHNFAEAEQDALLQTAGDSLLFLLKQVVSGRASIVQQVPTDTRVLNEVKSWLESLPARLCVASKSNVHR